MTRLLLIPLMFVAACDLTDGNPVADQPPAQLERFGKPVVVVHNGESIQSAVEAAGPNAIIHIEPGTYAEAVRVTQPGVRLIGLDSPSGDAVIIENPGGVRNGIDVRANDFALVNVTVRGFDANGVFLSGIDGFLLSRVIARDNGAYGLFPVRSRNGVIEHSEASGHRDAGFYVGQAANVIMRQNLAQGNVVGIEASNSSGVKLLANEARDNSNGILVVLLTGRVITSSSDILVAGNIVQGNNRPNFAAPGDIVAAVPAGTGLLVVGADRVTVEDNTVTGHDFIGIGVGSTLILAAIAGLPPEAFADIEPNADGVQVRGNRATGNGTSSPFPFLPPADLLWDGTGTGNCWTANVAGTLVPVALPAC
jgi:parallel beta-helix repeat protein